LQAQRKDRLYIKIDVSDSKNVDIKLDPSGKLTFKGISDNKTYESDLPLLHEVNVEESKWVVRPRYVDFLIKKKESGPYWPRLLKDEGKKSFLKVDWSHWKDEDEEAEDDGGFEGANAFDMSQMGGGGGDFGGFGGADADSSDDEAPIEEEEKKEVKEEEKNPTGAQD